MSRSHSAAIPLTTKPSDVVALHPAILQWALATAVALTVGIAGASFWLSFAVLRDLAVMAGIGPGEAWVIPVVLDGAIVSTTVTAIALSNDTDNRTIKGRRFVVMILRVAASASIAGNSYHAVLSATLLPAVVSAGIATIAPIALLAMTEVLAVILRAPRGAVRVEFTSSAATEEPDWTDTEFSQEGPSPSRDDSEGEDRTRGEHVETADSPRLQVDGLTPEVAETARLRHAHREWSWARIGRETDGSVASTAMRRYRKWEEVTAGIVDGHQDGQSNFDVKPASERDRMSAG
ncbi:hypothetical protein CH278_15275 [Rhodococcus sp. 05-2254-5]|uniref:DUF2637 domain-containing protein n=1 Tax=unclassified Rhodococcus (in: high G+C Gram-positive bacteria) TaxID=192944 RepID=UPI000B9AAE49|nr:MULTISPECIES: DUF2637 domain-containing protein [unclassified Rhodococcus (in: high G+C Gram-positive bacteria)]OZE32183.1 hypothetical protein CH278_15275 [Rhodococcus sp. 05-2254-5]OZE59607.1 hypothetical protein CH269_07060 [Rhodococcus sp. 05-2254-1]